MSTKNKYPRFIYMDESSISSLLLCRLCKQPLIEPVRTSNGRHMCQRCFNLSLYSSLSYGDSCTPIDEAIILEMLDDLSVRCPYCSQANIRRRDYQKHEQEVCTYAHVPCTAMDLRCDWTGPRKLLQSHLVECRMEPLRPILGLAQAQIREYQQRVTDLEEYLDRLIERNPFERHLMHLIKQCSSYSSIDLRSQKITDEHMELIVEHTFQRKHPTILDLSFNQITGQGAERLALALSTDITLEKLCLTNNHISDRGARALSQVLAEKNRRLRALKVESNGITDEGVQDLVWMLKMNRTLIYLSLSANQITNVGLNLLINAVIQNQTTIEELNLSGNQRIDDQSLNSLILLLECKHSLKKLTLIGCQISQQGQENLKQLFAVNKDFQLIF